MLRQTGDHHPDGKARQLFDAMLRAIGDFIDENPGLNPLVVEKLHFADSDLGRMANAIMRLCQYCESLAHMPESSTAASRRQWSVWEHCYAAYNWRRQLVFHLSHVGLMFPPSNTVAVAPGQVIQEELTDTEWLQRELLMHPAIPNETHTKEGRRQLQHVMRRRHIDQPARAVFEAALALVRVGILERTEPVIRSRQRGGWPGFRYRKRKWSEVEPNEAAQEHLGRLRVSSDFFEG